MTVLNSGGAVVACGENLRRLHMNGILNLKVFSRVAGC